jgi:GT2 family glycosyltransferase
MKNPLVSIISVNYNQTEVTCQMLESVQAQDYQNIEVIVVDNASKVRAAATIRARFPSVRVIESDRNLGFAGGNNLAVKEARGDYFFFINNDTELPQWCLRRLLDLFENKPKLGAVSPKILYFPETTDPNTQKHGHSNTQNIIQFAGTTPVHPITARNSTIGSGEIDLGQYAVPTPTAYVHGAAMLVSREVCEKAGLMAEDFFLYYEELDWSARIRRAGFELWVEPRAHIFHKESLTVSKMGALKSYFINRNRVYFMRRNFGGIKLFGFYAFLWLVTVPKNVFLHLIRGEFANARAFLQGIWWNFNPFPSNSPNKFERIRMAD